MAFAPSFRGVTLVDSNTCDLRRPGVTGFRCPGFVSAGSRLGKSRSLALRIVNAVGEYDFSDPDWKVRFKEEFESRFSLPHLRDVLDVKPRPTSFSLNTRRSHMLREERKNGYVNENDRALLKAIKYSSPDSAGAECIDPDCSWLEQWCTIINLSQQNIFQSVKFIRNIYYTRKNVKYFGTEGVLTWHLILQVSFELEGPYGLLKHLEHLVETKGSAVVCVAEGAGQDLLEKSDMKDATGNPVLSDIGIHIQQQIKRHFKSIDVPADVKYIDRTYMIRACRANASDAILCTLLGQNAVHGAFAVTVYLPIPEVISSPRFVDPNSRMWHRCLTSTGQPDFC
uniref:Uncharacterized protein n=1 Tax=Kalanchoe fedtschenkoi TaxID=63787 RepID=A0A7N0U8G8_KALFE